MSFVARRVEFNSASAAKHIWRARRFRSRRARVLTGNFVGVARGTVRRVALQLGGGELANATRLLRDSRA